jgi:hypothetical protein
MGTANPNKIFLPRVALCLGCHNPTLAPLLLAAQLIERGFNQTNSNGIIPIFDSRKKLRFFFCLVTAGAG